ncbi:hypothetical protein D3C87_1132220 [compost metagenome]
MTEQQRRWRQLRAQAHPDIFEVARRTVEQAAVGRVGQGVGVARVAEQTVEGAEVGRQCAQRTQQSAPRRVALDAQVFKGGVEVAQRFGETRVINKWLTHLDRFGQSAAGLALLAQQALAAEQHVAVEERFGQCVVRIVRRTRAFVDVLSEEVQFQVTADFRSGAAIADAVQDDFLGTVQRRHHATVLLGQFQPPGFDVHLPDRLEQRRFQLQVKAQLTEQARQTLLHRLVGKQRLPQHREQAVPRGTGDQQHRFVPEIGDRTAALINADHRVYRQNQRRRGNRAIALAERPEHGQAETGQRQCNGKHNGVREEQFHRQRGDAETHQCHGEGVEAALPTVVGFGQGAGDNPQEQRDQQAHFILIPTQRHAAGQGDEHPHAVAEFIQRPQAPQRLTKRGRGHEVRRPSEAMPLN